MRVVAVPVLPSTAVAQTVSQMAQQKVLRTAQTVVETAPIVLGSVLGSEPQR